jgi:hypothetical protein
MKLPAFRRHLLAASGIAGVGSLLGMFAVTPDVQGVVLVVASLAVAFAFGSLEAVESSGDVRVWLLETLTFFVPRRIRENVVGDYIEDIHRRSKTDRLEGLFVRCSIYLFTLAMMIQMVIHLWFISFHEFVLQAKQAFQKRSD